jgi:hypothetical protein
MKDHIITEGIDVVYCPREEMLADIFTKILQGSLFLKLKRVIMGEEHVSTLKQPLSLAPAQERVGDRNIAESTKMFCLGQMSRWPMT